MTEMLNIRIRQGKKTLTTLRKGGEMPAVFYGPKETSTPIVFSIAEFKKLWKKAGESTVVVLKGEDGEKEALIYDVDFDPITGEPRHADFYVMEKGKRVEVAVPLEFVGVAPAVKELGGVLVKALHELEIESLPKDLPHAIEIDVSSLVDFESNILAKDIKLPAGVALKTNPEEVVASTSEAKEEPEAPVAEMTIADIEVEKKGKKEEEGEGMSGEVDE